GAERAAWRLFFGIEPANRFARLVGGDGAKRNGAEVIENKQFREMAHFAPPMISRTYAPVAKPFISLPRNEPCCFCWISHFIAAQNAVGREIDASFGARAAEAARLRAPGRG